MMIVTKTDKPQRVRTLREEIRTIFCAFVILTVLCGYCFFAGQLLSAQTPHKQSSKELPPSAFKLIAVNTTGTKRFTSDEVIAASGLQIGQTVSEDDFKNAARLLGETGAFGDVLYSFQYSPDGAKLELQVQDSENFVPVHFDNFVWFSDQELLDQLRTQVPLFRAELPVGGNLADEVSNALQGLLIARNVQGRVDYLRAGQEDGPIEAFVFAVTGQQIHIRNLAFAGAGASELSMLESAAKKLQGAEFLRSTIRVQEDKNFLPIFLERGYLKATLGDAQAKVVQSTPQETSVDVTFPVNAGRQYKLTEIELRGYKAFSADALRALIHAQPDHPANAVQLDTDITAMKHLYGTRGYMEVKIQPNPELDEATSSVKYVLLIREGDVYSMGDLEFRGLDARATARLENDWRLRGGDPYDSGYPARFLNEEDKEIGIKADWNVSVRESVNRDDKTVDVNIRFDPKAK